MWIADKWQDYELLDCGGGEKLERWDKQFLVRPDPQAIWETPRQNPAWKRVGARYAALPDRRRTLGEEGSAGKLEGPLWRADLPGQAHELQAHGLVPGAGGELGASSWRRSAMPAGPSGC